MYLIDQIAEARIEQAVAAGELEDLPGAGVPLALDDDSSVPEALRVAYRVLKNAGFAPPEVEIRSEIREIESLIGCLEAGRAEAAKKLSLLRARLGCERGEPLELQSNYYTRLAEKLDRD